MTTDRYAHKTICLPSNTIAHNWTPTHPDPPRAILILQHGFGEYAQRYVDSHARLIPALIERNIDVWALDLEGHGRSPGENGRGVVDVERAVREHVWLCGYVAGIYSNGGGGGDDGDGHGTEGSTEDQTKQAGEDGRSKQPPRTQANEQAKGIAQRPPIFLFGHSLGGLVTAASATTLLAASRAPTAKTPDTAITIPTIQIRGLILTSPALPLPGLTPMHRLKALALYLLARALAYLFPSRQVPWPASPDGTLCGDAEEERRVAEDGVMFHGQISWTVAATAMGAVRGVWRGIRREVWESTTTKKGQSGREVDVLVLHGRGDCWTDWRASFCFVEGIRRSHGEAGAGARVPEGMEASGAELCILETPYHELLNAGGSEGQQVLGQILQWIEERI
ncbi:Alpha/Beta hydrolase protein [Aspergillus germanicus]